MRSGLLLGYGSLTFPGSFHHSGALRHFDSFPLLDALQAIDSLFLHGTHLMLIHSEVLVLASDMLHSSDDMMLSHPVITIVTRTSCPELHDIVPHFAPKNP